MVTSTPASPTHERARGREVLRRRPRSNAEATLNSKIVSLVSTISPSFWKAFGTLGREPVAITTALARPCARRRARAQSCPKNTPAAGRGYPGYLLDRLQRFGDEPVALLAHAGHDGATVHGSRRFNAERRSLSRVESSIRCGDEKLRWHAAHARACRPGEPVVYQQVFALALRAARSAARPAVPAPMMATSQLRSSIPCPS